jgi:hypothetical protein
MPSSSGSSNSEIERILARVDCSPTQAPPSPTPHIGFDTAGLGAIGAHLQLDPGYICPGHIDFPNEPLVPLQAYHFPSSSTSSTSPTSPTLPSLQTLSSYTRNRAGALPPTPTLTPTERAPHLSFEEYSELMHRRADDECRNDRVGMLLPSTVDVSTSAWRLFDCDVITIGKGQPRCSPVSCKPTGYRSFIGFAYMRSYWQ